MNLTQVNRLVVAKKAVTCLRPVYPCLSVSDVEVMQAVNLSCVGLNGCPYLAIDQRLTVWDRGKSQSKLFDQLARLVGLGLVDKQMYGKRNRYSLTIQGMNCLCDMERMLRKLRP